MPLFQQKHDEVSEAILAEIRELSKRVTALKGERDAAREELQLSTDIVRLKRELTDLEIAKDREKEQHEREKREVEHMVGLEKKRSSFEIDAAKREMSLNIREENLAADRARFEEQMQFMTERMSEEVTYLRDIAEKLMQRLPNVEVNKTLEVIDGPTGTKRRRVASDG